MSIGFHSKCLSKEESVTCGAASFAGYRIKLVKAVDDYFGFIYKAFYFSSFGWGVKGNIADWRMDITEYIENNIVVKDKPLSTKEKIEETFSKIKKWVAANGGVVYDLNLNVEFLKDKWIYRLLGKIDWDLMYDWMENNLSNVEIDFFLASDSEGKWSKKECKKLYKTFSKYDMEYSYRDNYKATKGLHKMLLNAYRKCWENKAKLKWN